MRNIIQMTASLVILLASATVHADERKVIIDLRSDNTSRIEARLIGDLKDMREHYRAQGHELTAVVVISGRAYKYFIEDLEDSPYKGEEGLSEVNSSLVPLLQELARDYDVDFQMCTVGMETLGIEKDVLYPFVGAVTSQPILLIDHQNDGYAYLPIT